MKDDRPNAHILCPREGVSSCFWLFLAQRVPFGGTGPVRAAASGIRCGFRSRPAPSAPTEGSRGG